MEEKLYRKLISVLKKIEFKELNLGRYCLRHPEETKKNQGSFYGNERTGIGEPWRFQIDLCKILASEHKATMMDRNSWRQRTEEKLQVKIRSN